MWWCIERRRTPRRHAVPPSRGITWWMAYLLFLGAAACATSSSSDPAADQPAPEEECDHWRIEVNNGGPAEISVYYMKAGLRSFLDIVGPHSLRTFFVTQERKPYVVFTVERTENIPMSVTQSKLIKHTVTCAN